MLLDDGIELPYDAESFAETGLRHLRLGQRVRIETAGAGADSRVVALQIYTLHDRPSEGESTTS